MYEKNKKFINFVVIALCSVLCILSGCQSTRSDRTGVDTTLLQYQEGIGRAEGTTAAISDTIVGLTAKLADSKSSLERITETIDTNSERIGDCERRLGEIANGIGKGATTVDGIINEFDQYQSIVEELLRYYRELTDEVRAQAESANYLLGDIDIDDNSQSSGDVPKN